MTESIRRTLLAAFEEFAPAFGGVLLDVGSGTAWYRPWVSSRVDRYITVDEDPAVGPDIVGDATAIPVADGFADTVLCLSVLELISEPSAAFAEFARVLKPGGTLVLVTSQNWRELRTHDYFRFTSQGVALLAERAGLDVIAAVGRGGFFAQLAAKLATYTRDGLQSRSALRAGVSPLVGVLERILLSLDVRSPYLRDPLVVVLVARRP
jgi:SAM-dependent methyltransferase